MPAGTELEEAIARVVSELSTSADPEVGAKLLPGYVIHRAPLSRAVIAAQSLPKATAARQAAQADRKRKVWEVIQDQLVINPAITDAELAAALNQAGLATYTKLAFTASRVRDFVNREKRK